MSHETIGLIGFIGLLVLIAFGVPVGFAGLIAGMIGLVVIQGTPVLSFIGSSLFNITGEYGYTVVPLFILMGGLAFGSGVATRAFDVARRWIGHVPGGMIATVSITGALFGAVTGSSTASVVTLGKVAGADMVKMGYKRGTVAAAIASIGGLAVLIPPSGMMVILGMITGTSIAKLLIAGILPGILNTAIFVIIAVVMGKLRPKEMPPGPRFTWGERIKSLPKISGIALIALPVIITIYTGVATPTEAAAFGAVAAIVVAIMLRTPWSNIGREITGAARTTAKIFILIAGMMYFSRFIALTGLAATFVDWIIGISPSVPLFLLFITIMYLILGMFMEFLGAMLITLPFVWPAALGLGIDPVQLGVCMVLLAEIAVITPPVGLNIFVIRGVMTDVPMEETFKAILPFVLGFLLTLLILYCVPSISLLLPNTM
jgi:tripartite ATP-independent transporter DctM subunit